MTKKFLSENAELMKEWDWEANVDLDPNKVTYGSHKKAWWKCQKCGYKWHQAIMERTRKVCPAHCPCCTSRVVVKGINDFATFHPEDVKDWHPTKNGKLQPDMIMKSSSKRIWWQCQKCGHEWQTTARSKRGCPRCLHSATAGKDDLATLRPDLAKEWHPTKNGDLKPTDVKLQSNKKVWWLCPNNHEYQAVIGARTRGGNKASNCPVCNKQNRTSFPEQAVFYYVKKLYPDALNSYRAPFLGLMELDIFIPSLNWAIEYDGAQWHKNDKLTREQQKYQKCVQQKVKLIRIREKMAPLGSDIADEQISIVKLNGIPNLEETIKYIIKRLNFSNKPIDINFSRDEIKIRESYQSKVKDSVANLHPELIKEWHPTKNGFLTPYDCKVGSTYKVWWQCTKCGYEWQASAEKRCSRGHGCLNCSKQAPLVGVNDLETLYPRLAKEWHPTKNGSLTPKDIRPKSNRKYWWKCQKCGYEWQASGNNRIGHKSDCPACAGRVPRIGSNDLFTVCPHLKDEWDFDLNKGIDPITVPIGSHVNVWWKCSKCGHKWQASIRRRAKGSQCPCCCANRVVAKGINDLATLYPEIAKEWHPTKNDALTPEKIFAKSHKKVWWQCSKCGYEWQTSVYNKTRDDSCPCCSNRVVVPGKNDLATLRPDLAKEWHPTKNGKLTPTDVVAGTGKKVWWKCRKCGHEWQTTVYDRAKGTGCIKCGIERTAQAMRKSVQMIDPKTGAIIKTFKSISDAAQFVNSKHIGAVCQGLRHKAGGYIWRYVDEQENKKYQKSKKQLEFDFSE